MAWVLTADGLAAWRQQSNGVACWLRHYPAAPGTAKGFVFLSVEEETGIANVIITPDVFEQNRVVVSRSRFLAVETPLQKQDDLIHVKAARMVPLADLRLEVRSKGFH